jgi:hypothetical protein
VSRLQRGWREDEGEQEEDDDVFICFVNEDGRIENCIGNSHESLAFGMQCL